MEERRRRGRKVEDEREGERKKEDGKGDVVDDVDDEKL